MNKQLIDAVISAIAAASDVGPACVAACTAVVSRAAHAYADAIDIKKTIHQTLL